MLQVTEPTLHSPKQNPPFLAPFWFMCFRGIPQTSPHLRFDRLAGVLGIHTPEARLDVRAAHDLRDLRGWASLGVTGRNWA